MSQGISAQGLSKRFGATQALDGVDLAVPAGTVLGLLGPNGAGKTTVVRILATLVAADGGTATVGGFDVQRQAHQVRQSIGLTGQYASVDEKLTGRENLKLIARLLDFSRDEARERADALLADFDLLEAADRPVLGYSGGMRRRLDLAASLVGRPAFLFLDEPTTGLDPRARLSLWALIRRLVSEGTTVLLTTQYLEEADALADRIVVLDRGRVIAEGTAEQLKARVGAQTLVVRARDAADLPKLVEILAAESGARPEVDDRRASVPAPDPALLPQLLRALDAAGIAVDELLLRGASLDDVFLALTGRHAEAENPETEEQA
ncbi:daunorubicin resistance protein DrrA family ABC transporter ATP-binding protein [Algiphilus aromaticivorans]|jgi:oleandomycin transport system ATP-binding protein|uniref:daunorubicin resistance protein DrrA family ABC transporter ATP-binding protein n=1 Tax=Algiphilus aromaticivorans TaxID=382454 RepID=UPI0005C25A1C|nr:daunorubicin resistance protein DrrA family ABC transporter ATP-binding protein [Algiphilus aromaticivorans]